MTPRGTAHVFSSSCRMRLSSISSIRPDGGAGRPESNEPPSDDAADMMWGDVGQLYYLARSPSAPEDALLTMQCG